MDTRHTSTTTTTTQAIVSFAAALAGRNYAPRTVRSYQDDVEQFIAWVGKNRVDWDTPSRLTRLDIVGFLTHLAARKATGVTRARKLAAIRAFFAFLAENGLIAGNPAAAVSGPLKERRNPQVLYRNEYKALLFEASGNARDFAILQVFLQCGLRVGELVGLTLADADLQNRELHVRQAKGKRDRTIPLEQQAIDAIGKYLKVRTAPAGEETLFLARNGTSLNVRTVRWLVHKYLTHAGIRKKASVHTLRHTFGTHKVDKGMPIPALQALMGHRQKETTFKYVHLADTNLRAIQEQTAL